MNIIKQWFRDYATETSLVNIETTLENLNIDENFKKIREGNQDFNETFLLYEKTFKVIKIKLRETKTLFITQTWIQQMTSYLNTSYNRLYNLASNNSHQPYLHDALNNLNEVYQRIRASEYSSSENSQISNIEIEYNSKLQIQLEKLNEYKALYDNILKQNNEINKIHSELFHDKGEELSTKNKINDINNKFQEVEKYHEKVLLSENSISSQINIAKVGFESNLEEIKERKTSSINELDKLDIFYNKVIGTNDGKILGLEKTIKEKLNEFDKFHKEKKEKAEELLSRAEIAYDTTTTGELVGIFSKERKSHEKNLSLWWKLFAAGIIGVFVATSCYYKFFYLNNHTYLNLFRVFPFASPFIWFTTIASKKLNQATRLEAEYMHKEAVAQSYIGYKKQIEDLNLDDNGLIIKLLEANLEALILNPSKTLDKKHEDLNPYDKLFNLLSQDGLKALGFNIKNVNEKVFGIKNNDNKSNK